MVRSASPDSVVKIPRLILWAILAYLAVRALNAIIFEFAFRVRKGYEAPTLVRNVFSIVAFTLLFVVILKEIYVDVNLGALFTTSAIFGVIIGLALQDTLGNFFAGISLHADRPFQVGDVITVGQQKHTGVVESITWRAVKIRTFQNHIVLVSNSSAAKEAIEVCPRDNLNARLVYFSTREVIELTPRVGLVGHDGWSDGRAGDYGRSDVFLNDYLLIEELAEPLAKEERLARLNRLGDEAAEHICRVLPPALDRYAHVIVLTHVPPFREACWHEGRISDDDWAPHFTCVALGEALRRIAREYPHRQITVLCGHTHSAGEAQISHNLLVLTGGAVYGQLEIQRVFEFE